MLQIINILSQRVCATLNRVRLKVPLDTVKVISETIFYRSDNPTDSIKALKEGG